MSVRSQTLKRLIKERQLMEQSPCREFVAHMLEDNALEWHFTMLGPPDSPYEKGYYHGKILIPPDYPFKPPDVVLLTPNGRFELDKRICLSISSYHPENWHPTWGIATVLHALREFMATPGNNAIGAIEYPKSVREDLALKSAHFCCAGCGKRNEDARESMMQAPPASESDKRIQIASTPLVSPASPPQPAAKNPGDTDDAHASSTGMQLPAACESPKAPATAEPEARSPRKEEIRSATASQDAAAQGVAGPSASEVLPIPETEANGSATQPDAPIEAPQPQPAAAPDVAPAAAVRRPRVFERRGGEVVVNVSIATVDRAIQMLLLVVALILCKKAFVDHWEVMLRYAIGFAL